MLGLFLVVAGVVLASYLIIKRNYAPWSLMLVGLILLICVGVITGEPLLTNKTKTNFFGFDLVQTFTNIMKSRAAGLGMNIMVVGGFAFYMEKIGATKALVDVCIKPLSLIKAPYILLGVAYLIGQILNVFIPSATGLGLLLMVTIFPLLVSVGVSRVSAAAVIVTASCLDLGPASGNSLMASELCDIHVMEYFVNGQIPIAAVVVPTIIISHIFIQRWFDKRDRASGRLTATDFMVIKPDEDVVKAKDKSEGFKAPAFYAILPILPVVLLFVFSKLMITTVRLEVCTALFVCTIIAFIVDLLTRRDFTPCVNRTKAMFDGMGKVFSSTVVLIACAELFATGLKKSGGIDTLLTWAANIEGAGGVTMLIVMFLIMGLAAFVTGSGNAAFFAFSPLLPQAATSVGWQTIALAAPVQLASGIARSMSPISGVTMGVSGLAEVSPFEIVRRTIPVMLITMIMTVLVGAVAL